MVVGENVNQTYSPLRFDLPSDEGFQSSEDGSGLHSPVMDVFPQAPRIQHNEASASLVIPSEPNKPFSSSVNKARYQHHTVAFRNDKEYDFTQSLNKSQQTPSLDTQPEHPTPNAQQITLSHYNLTSRYHSGQNFFVQLPASSRFPPSSHATNPINMRFLPSTTERRSPSGHSHDPLYYQIPEASLSVNANADHRPNTMVTHAGRAERSISSTASASRGNRKGLTPVVIACRLCRSRKIRCDSTRPSCNNCLRRNNECEYDAMPKRRGPDKRPGTRQRRCKKRAADETLPSIQKRRRTFTDPSIVSLDPSQGHTKENMSESRQSPLSPVYPERASDPQTQLNTPALSPNLNQPSMESGILSKEEIPTYHRHQTDVYDDSYTRTHYPRPVDVNIFPDAHHENVFSSSPIHEAQQREWWDKIILTYPPQDIVAQLDFLLAVSSHQASFINIEFLAPRLFDEAERFKIHPSFILAALALAQLLRSSNVEQGLVGMQQAVNLRLQAQAALDESYRSGLLNADLAKAAFLLAVFESSAYTNYSYDRNLVALRCLDDIISSLALTTNDANDPDVCRFSPNSPPRVLLVDGSSITGKKCRCLLGEDDDLSNDYINRTYKIPWVSTWSTSQIHDEAIRRLCWSSLSLVAEHNVQCIALQKHVPKLYLSEVQNIALLFPGEVYDRVQRHEDSLNPLTVKETVWGLYCRSILLWNFCVELQQGHTEVEDKIEAMTISISEAQIIEDALFIHRCNLDTTILYRTREYLFNIRMLIAQELRTATIGLIRNERPKLFSDTRQIQAWVGHQEGVVRRVQGIIDRRLNADDASELTRKPWTVSWFVNQLQIAVTIWSYEPMIIGLLELARDLLLVTETLNVLWPCPENSRRVNHLRTDLINVCNLRKIPSPFSSNYVEFSSML